MKAMVLAAGLGTRMRPLTQLRAKPALPVLDEPLLRWTVRLLVEQGFREIVVNTHHLPGTVRRALGDGGALGARVRYSHEPEVLGTGGGPRKVRGFFGAEPVLIVNGDVVFDFDLRGLVEGHRRAGAAATLGLRPNPDPERYGPVVTDRRGRILSILGRPEPARGTVSMFTGIHVLEPGLLRRLPAGVSDSVRDLYIPLLAEGALLRGVRLRGPWHDLGTPESYRRTQLRLLAGGFRGLRRRPALISPRARVGRGAEVRRSVVGAGCVVGEGARVADSVLWGGARVAPGARVQAAVVAGAVEVEAGAVARGVVAGTREAAAR